MRLVIANRVVAELNVGGVISFDVQPTSATKTPQVKTRVGASYVRMKDRGNLQQTMTILVYREFGSIQEAEHFLFRHATLLGSLRGEGVEYLNAEGNRYIFPDAVINNAAVVERLGVSLTYSYTFQFGAIFQGWMIALMDNGVRKIITITTPADGTIVPLIEAN